MIFIIVLLLSCKFLFAPGFTELCIFKSEAMNSYEPLLKAITWIESHDGKNVYNAKEGAVGWFQIRQCRIDHYNKLTGSNYNLEDCYDYELSREIFLYFAQGKTYEQAAKNWNGSGKMTIDYWNKVKAKLNN